MREPWNLCCFTQQRRNLKVTHLGRQECRQTAASAGRNIPCFVQMLPLSVGKSKKSAHWKAIDLVKTVEALASARLGDQLDELSIGLMVHEVREVTFLKAGVKKNSYDHKF